VAQLVNPALMLIIRLGSPPASVAARTTEGEVQSSPNDSESGANTSSEQDEE
jgi:hypothetical protein